MFGHSPFAAAPFAALEDGAGAVTGEVAFSGEGTFAASGTKRLLASAAFSGVGTFDADGVVIKDAACSFSGVGSFAASGLVKSLGSFSASGVGTFNANGDIQGFSSVSFSGVGTFNASGRVAASGAVGFSGVGTFEASVLGPLDGSVEFSGVGSFSATGMVRVAGSIQFSGVGSVSFAPFAVTSVGFSGVGTFRLLARDSYFPYDTSLREFQADFENPAGVLSGIASTVIRPDAITFNRQIAFTIGPRNIADLSETILSRAWYVRNSENVVYYARANDANTGWEAEQVLFSYTGAPIVEIDCAFEQAGRLVVVAERHTGASDAPEMWVYWFDPTEIPPDFVFENFGPGRTPVCVLDNPEDTTNSNVQILYYKPGTGVVRLQQDERYQTEHATPRPYNDNHFLEDLVITRGRRMVGIYSRRDVVRGRYGVGRIESLLYPVYPNDKYTAHVEILSGEMDVVLIIEDLFDKDKYTAAVDVISGSLALVMIEHVTYDKDIYTAEVDVLSGDLVEYVIEEVLYDKDIYTAEVDVLSGTLVVSVIESSLVDKDTYTANVNVLSGILEPA